MRFSAKCARLSSTALVCAGLLLIVLGLHAAVLRTVPDGFTRRVWQTEDGLPENTVQAFAQTPDHYLWIGTAGGLVRFDGERFVVFDRENTKQIRENSIFCLMVARDGTLWAGTEGGGLLQYKNGTFRSYGEEEGLTNGFVRSVFEDHTGTVWIGTDGGLFRLEGDEVVRVDGSDRIPLVAVHAIYEDRLNRLWVGGSRVLMIQGHTSREFHLSGSPSADRVKSILETSDGTVWVGTVSGLERLAPSSKLFEKVPEITSTVRVLREDDAHTLWIGTIGAGLIRYRNRSFTRVATPEDPPSSTILAILQDDEQNIWIGLQTGLLRLSKAAMSTFPLPGAENADFETIYPDRDGSLWVASTYLYRIDPRRNGSRMIPPPEPGIRVRCVYRDRAGDWWVGTEGYGVFLYAGKHRYHYTRRDGLVNDFIRAFLESRDGTIWIGTDEGISCWRHGTFTNYTMNNGLVYFSIHALLEDGKGDIWIGTDGGINHWSKGHFVRDAVTRALKNQQVWTIHEDPEGGLWFGTRGSGLFRWRDEKLTLYTTEQGLASNSIYKILEDSRGMFWVSGPTGISSVTRADLDRYAENPRLSPAVTLYGLSDSVAATQTYGGVQPAGCLTKNGEVWFPTNRGPVRILPNQTRPRGLPQVQIEDVLVDGREAPISGNVVLSPGEGRLEVGYSAIRLRSQEQIRFRYMLEPFDKDWIEGQRNRVAYYTNLPPGKYRFRVQAYEMNMPERVTEASVGIDWKPHVYRTPWFLSLCAAVLVALMFLAYRFRLQQVRARFEAVLEERNRIAREMHDTVIQGCTSASALLEAVVSLDPDESGPHRELLDSARQQVRATVDEARLAVWNLRRDDGDAPGIGLLLDQMAKQVSHLSHVPIQSEAFGRPVPLDGVTEHIVLMVAREAVYNAVRHSQANQVWVRLHFEFDSLRMEVEDDGGGFDPEQAFRAPGAHFGLLGMRERVESAGGTLEVQSSARGTTLTVVIPVAKPAERRVTV
jgi:ligand-binding sensor domain-containing protein/signal transduction histidine kinase